MMEKFLTLVLFTINSPFLLAQIILTIEGTVVNDTVTGMTFGVNIPRSEPTIFTYRNNSITSVSSDGYMLLAGDESPGITNNNLDGEVITGNMFIWNGTDPASISHSVFTGYNINAVLKYNYLKKTPFGLLRKSNGMTNTSGGVAYNIVVDPVVGSVAKGMNNVNFYNNTFFRTKEASECFGRPFIDIYNNTDEGLNAPSIGAKVFNNIFYSKHQTFNISIENSCLSGFESDYNIFWCETGEPIFWIQGVTKTFTEWQALGFDTHSVVINPDFIDFIDFIPRTPLHYGKNLGADWQSGLSVDAVWGTTDPETTNQNGTWQVGARIYDSTTGIETNPGPSKTKNKKVTIYPNPIYDFLNISIEDPLLLVQSIKITDLYGSIVFKDSIEQGFKNIQIPENIKPGIYIICLESGGLVQYSQKLSIIK